MPVEIISRQKDHPIAAKTVKATTQKILNVLGCDEFVVSVAFVESGEIAELNQKYRRKRGPTDVLSFPMFNANELADVASFLRQRPIAPHPVLGDVVICPAVASRHAAEAGKTLESEITFLTVHAMLHLLGYDHETAADARRMRRKEQEVLAAIEGDAS